MPDIFISYANADREHARQLADRLTARGYSVWWDRTIPPGRVFDEVLQEAIQAARCMIVLWSAESVRSNWVKTEAAEGVERDILVPALIDEVSPPIEFKRIQAANLAHWDGDDAHGEYVTLIDAVERLMKQAPRASATPASGVQAHRPRTADTPSRMGTIKTFGLGAVAALAVVGAYWLYGQLGKKQAIPPVASAPASAPPSTAPNPPAAAVAPPAAKAAPGGTAARGRINLLSAEHGGQLLVASSNEWHKLIDGKEDTYGWTQSGFGVFGFRDGRSAQIDTFTVFVPEQADHNLKDFELFVGNVSPTGPFESVGKFATQNMRMMQKPFQEFKFAPVKAKYFKLQSVRTHADHTSALVYEIQLFGELQ